ncbi:MAG: ribonuclease III [Actinomycetota bacterium]|nr:ribonuclease III [Actinomycetota bacterium]
MSPPSSRSPDTGGADRQRLRARLGPELDEELFALALTHRSYCAEHPGTASNERLEFLGDAVLGLVVTTALYLDHPDLPEGDLARIRASVVSSNGLAPVAAELGLGEALLLGRGEELSGGRDKPSLLADALEAVIGAVYLAGGLDRARSFVLGLLEARLEAEAGRSELGDPKNRLQELLAKHGHPPPAYETAEQGPDHAKQFSATVLLGEALLGRGRGPSKKAAERAAAEAAIARLGEGGVPSPGGA